MKIALEHAESAGACSSPGIDRLEGVAHRAHSGAFASEQGGDKRRLRGGCVLVFVEQHMAEPFAIAGPDGGETSDELVCGDGEIAEFRHIQPSFLRGIGLYQIEHHVALFGGLRKRGARVDAGRMRVTLI